MQPNEITLSVDEQNDGVGPVNHVFSRFEDFQNRSTYVSSDHTIALKDTLGFYRTPPKPNGTFKGVAKTSFKISKDILVAGVDGVSQLTAPIIMEVSFSVPVGATTAQILRERQRLVSLLDRDDIMSPLNEKQMV